MSDIWYSNGVKCAERDGGWMERREAEEIVMKLWWKTRLTNKYHYSYFIFNKKVKFINNGVIKKVGNYDKIKKWILEIRKGIKKKKRREEKRREERKRGLCNIEFKLNMYNIVRTYVDNLYRI